MRICCVKNCRNNFTGSTTTVNRKVTYFRFPKRQGLRSQWKKIVNLNTKIGFTTLVCCDHFEPKYIYMKSGSPNLRPDTIPTIFAGSEFKIEPEKSVSSSLLSVEEKIEPENSTSSLLLSDEVNIKRENSMSSLSPQEHNHEPITKKSKLDLPVKIFIPLPTSQDSNITANITALPQFDVDEINDETPLSLDLLREIPKKMKIKVALKSSTFEGNLSLSQTLMRTKSKLENLRVAYENLQKKATNLQRIFRRRNEEILQFKMRLEDEKRKNLRLEDEKRKNLRLKDEKLKNICYLFMLFMLLILIMKNNSLTY